MVRIDPANTANFSPNLYGRIAVATSSEIPFKNGELWGVFLGVDDSTIKSLSFDKGRVLIATESSSIIDERISLEINGVLLHVKILEDQNSISQVWEEKMDERSLVISSESSDSMDIDSLVEESLVGQAENIKQCPSKVTALGQDDDHMDNSKTKDDGKWVTVDDEVSIENFNCEEAADFGNSDCDEVDCSIANGVGNIDDDSQPNSTNGLVANSKLSNSIVVKDAVLARLSLWRSWSCCDRFSVELDVGPLQCQGVSQRLSLWRSWSCCDRFSVELDVGPLQCQGVSQAARRDGWLRAVATWDGVKEAEKPWKTVSYVWRRAEGSVRNSVVYLCCRLVEVPPEYNFHTKTDGPCVTGVVFSKEEVFWIRW
ncbi:hypothetical protein Vadar_027993 [Vaccinium darrowii]|uniref:Uncharacterized protein n=1 Tax=Vaccinium darrowii TaxID=229202 RepID=A0ACB7XCT1_9ERIC|nr:hypothetical protein Vadar_027993 [Vaccinium darrowii]